MNKKEEILKVALSEFAKNGYENTSLEEIAKKCNITKPAIYYHFKSKNELYNEVFCYVFKELDLSCVNNLKSFIKTINKFFDNDKAKLFSKEISNEMKNLNDNSLSYISQMPKKLKELLNDNANLFFIQMIIVSTLITYKNAKNTREKLAPKLNEDPSFDIEEELFSLLKNYTKDKI